MELVNIIALALAGVCIYLVLDNGRANANCLRYHDVIQRARRRGHAVPLTIIQVDDATFPQDIHEEDEVAA